ncbi:hypothetical protein C8Q76DRAFT_800328 [Earliella scabrosa]|nr:hypothetical protein C8Q76DRAFT_800328 [Earliella scabrosa]
MSRSGTHLSEHSSTSTLTSIPAEVGSDNAGGFALLITLTIASTCTPSLPSLGQALAGLRGPVHFTKLWKDIANRELKIVDNSLVRMAGEPDVGQHLLVALKLLPDLRCYERTKMLCVNNREWLSEEHEMGSLLWPHPDHAHYTHVYSEVSLARSRVTATPASPLVIDCDLDMSDIGDETQEVDVWEREMGREFTGERHITYALLMCDGLQPSNLGAAVDSIQMIFDFLCQDPALAQVALFQAIPAPFLREAVDPVNTTLPKDPNELEHPSSYASTAERRPLSRRHSSD